jgi:hypothetical protein
MPGTKKPSQRTARARAKTPVKASAPSGKAFIRIYHSESLHAKTVEVLTALEKSKDRTQHRAALANTIVELTAAGMDYCFLKPLKLAQAGFITEQWASLGVAGTMRILDPVVHSIIGRMNNAQLRTVCSYMRQLMK